MSQVIPFPQQQQQVQAAPDSYLPPFPMLALSVDSHARRVPWYGWLAVGMYLMYRLIRSAR